MSGLFDGTPLERPVTCTECAQTLDRCACPRGVDGAVVRPQDQRLRIRREKRRKGKLVTVVQGFDPVASDLNAILRRLKASCGAGGTVDAGVLEIQGDHGPRLAELLNQMGYPVTLQAG